MAELPGKDAVDGMGCLTNLHVSLYVHGARAARQRGCGTAGPRAGLGPSPRVLPSLSFIPPLIPLECNLYTVKFTLLTGLVLHMLTNTSSHVTATAVKSIFYYAPKLPQTPFESPPSPPPATTDLFSAPTSCLYKNVTYMESHRM